MVSASSNLALNIITIYVTKIQIFTTLTEYCKLNPIFIPNYVRELLFLFVFYFFGIVKNKKSIIKK